MEQNKLGKVIKRINDIFPRRACNGFSPEDRYGVRGKALPNDLTQEELEVITPNYAQRFMRVNWEEAAFGEPWMSKEEYDKYRSCAKTWMDYASKRYSELNHLANQDVDKIRELVSAEIIHDTPEKIEMAEKMRQMGAFRSF